MTTFPTMNSLRQGRDVRSVHGNWHEVLWLARVCNTAFQHAPLLTRLRCGQWIRSKWETEENISDSISLQEFITHYASLHGSRKDNDLRERRSSPPQAALGLGKQSIRLRVRARRPLKIIRQLSPPFPKSSWWGVQLPKPVRHKAGFCYVCIWGSRWK